MAEKKVIFVAFAIVKGSSLRLTLMIFDRAPGVILTRNF
jgi:hypothetical protein